MEKKNECGVTQPSNVSGIRKDIFIPKKKKEEASSDNGSIKFDNYVKETQERIDEYSQMFGKSMPPKVTIAIKNFANNFAKLWEEYDPKPHTLGFRRLYVVMTDDDKAKAIQLLDDINEVLEFNLVPVEEAYNKSKLQESEEKDNAQISEDVSEEMQTKTQIDTASDLTEAILDSSFEPVMTDEKEAIEGYNKFLAILTPFLPFEVYNIVKENIDEIIQDEVDHQAKLNSLYESLKPFIKADAPVSDSEITVELSEGYHEDSYGKSNWYENINDVINDYNKGWLTKSGALRIANAEGWDIDLEEDLDESKSVKKEDLATAYDRTTETGKEIDELVKKVGGNDYLRITGRAMGIEEFKKYLKEKGLLK